MFANALLKHAHLVLKAALLRFQVGAYAAVGRNSDRPFLLLNARLFL
jgi:hypothetical protein